MATPDPDRFTAEESRFFGLIVSWEAYWMTQPRAANQAFRQRALAIRRPGLMSAEDRELMDRLQQAFPPDRRWPTPLV